MKEIGAIDMLKTGGVEKKVIFLFSNMINKKELARVKRAIGEKANISKFGRSGSFFACIIPFSGVKVLELTLDLKKVGFSVRIQRKFLPSTPLALFDDDAKVQDLCCVFNDREHKKPMARNLSRRDFPR